MADQPLQADERVRAGEYFRLYDEVRARVLRGFTSRDVEKFHDAFITAALELSRRPDIFDPSRGTMADLLAGATRRRSSLVFTKYATGVFEIRDLPPWIR